MPDNVEQVINTIRSMIDLHHKRIQASLASDDKYSYVQAMEAMIDLLGIIAMQLAALNGQIQVARGAMPPAKEGSVQ